MGLIIILIIVGVLIFGGFAWLVIGGAVWVGHEQDKAEKNAPAALDDLFDGRDNVTFQLNMRTMKYDTVVLGAKERGYKLEHQAGDPNGAMTLLFEKA